MSDEKLSPEAEALTRIEKAIKMFENAMDGEFDPKSLSALDTYRKLVAEAQRLRAVLASQVKAEPLTKRLRLVAGQDFNPTED